ncbi:MAG: hypothetical protein ACTSW1_18190 [Candidatus Hodarchaeales archaeon]
MVLNSETPIIGTIISLFSDSGPQVIFNSTKTLVSEDQALNLAIRIMTLIGEQGRTEIYGPLPVPSNEQYLCLAYSFRVQATYTTDERLRERPSIICIIFKREFKRDMSRAHGLILSYLSKFTSEDIKTEDDLNRKKMNEIDKRLSAIITANPVRIFRITDNKIIEHMGDFYIPSDAYVIVDFEKKTLYILFDPHLSPVRKREVGIIIDKMEEKRRGGFNKRIVDSPEEADRLLHFYGLNKDKV